MTEELGSPVPQLGKFLDIGVERVVAENQPQVGYQVLQIAGFEQRESSLVDLEHATPVPAGSRALGIFEQEILQAGTARPSPVSKQRFDLAQILEPQRDRRELEHQCIVAIPSQFDP